MPGINVNLTNTQKTKVKEWAKKELFTATMSGRKIDRNKVKELTQEQRAIVLGAIGADSGTKRVPVVRRTEEQIDQIINHLPRGEVFEHEKERLVSMIKRVKKLGGKHIEVDTVTRALTEKWMKTREGGEFDRLGVIGGRVAIAVNKVLDGMQLEAEDKARLKKRGFVVLEDSDQRPIAIVNKALALQAGANSAVYRAMHLPTKEDRAVALESENRHRMQGVRPYAREIDIEIKFSEAFDDHSDKFVTRQKVTVLGTNMVGMIMPLASGGDLFDKIDRGSLTADEIKRYTTRLLKAVQTMHDRGWTHRDIKPENLLIDGDGNLLVTDFGYAIEQTEGIPAGPGTPLFAAPEWNRDNVSSKYDCFAAGLILYTMLTGENLVDITDDGFLDEESFDRVKALNFKLEQREQELVGKPVLEEKEKGELALIQTLRGLLAVHPEDRLSAGDAYDILNECPHIEEGISALQETLQRP